MRFAFVKQIIYKNFTHLVMLNSIPVNDTIVLKQFSDCTVLGRFLVTISIADVFLEKFTV